MTEENTSPNEESEKNKPDEPINSFVADEEDEPQPGIPTEDLPEGLLPLPPLTSNLDEGEDKEDKAEDYGGEIPGFSSLDLKVGTFSKQLYTSIHHIEEISSPLWTPLPTELPEEQFDIPEPDERFLQPPDPNSLPPTNPWDWDEWGDDPRDTPPPHIYGEEIEGKNNGALFVSDFHISDGTVGDDFFHNHLQSTILNRRRIYIGNRKQGPSRSRLFAAILTFTIQRLRQVGINTIDIVLNGDTVDLLELISRGTNLSSQHNLFFGIIQAARALGNDVYYLRGNHDFVAPPGPWTAIANIYANRGLTTMAEHGDKYDRANWPRGLNNTGSGIVMKVGPLENFFTVLGPRGGVYDLAGIDNIRPLTARSMRNVLQARIRNAIVRNQVLPLLAFLAGLAGLNIADDRNGYRGALRQRARGRFLNWLTVQGHTHIPIAVPTVHYNTATWISSLLRLGQRAEILIDILPFLIVYKDPNTGQRVEEYFTFNVNPQNRGILIKRNNAGVNRIRQMMGHRPLP